MRAALAITKAPGVTFKPGAIVRCHNDKCVVCLSSRFDSFENLSDTPVKMLNNVAIFTRFGLACCIYRNKERDVRKGFCVVEKEGLIRLAGDKV